MIHKTPPDEILPVADSTGDLISAVEQHSGIFNAAHSQDKNLAGEGVPIGRVGIVRAVKTRYMIGAFRQANVDEIGVQENVDPLAIFQLPAILFAETDRWAVLVAYLLEGIRGTLDDVIDIFRR